MFSGQAATAPLSDANDGIAPPPSNVPEPPPPPGTAMVDQDDGEFEDDIRCYVLYDFQGTVSVVLWSADGSVIQLAGHLVSWSVDGLV